VEDPALEVIHARSLLIHSSERIGVTLDGEVMRMNGPVFIGVIDRGLRVTVPDPHAEEAGGSEGGGSS
jgi:diacylglycerol kinase family enzyme